MNVKRVLVLAAILSFALVAAPMAKAADNASYTQCTVAEVFAKKDALAGKNISVKGKVVKFSGGIMGTNWFHIKDGTGSAGTDDLVVTSDDVAKVGDQVVVKGELSRDVDFGAGYKYAVIVQKGKVTAK